MGRIDWLSVKNEFVSNSTTTYASVAEKYGTTVRSVMRHAHKEGWMGMRKEVEERAAVAIVEKAVEQIEEVNGRHVKAYKNLQAFALTQLNILYEYTKDAMRKAKVEGRTLTPRDLYNSQQLKFLAETLRIGMDGERVARGIPTVVTKGEQDINVKSEFAEQPVEELERLYKTIDAPHETDTGTNK